MLARRMAGRLELQGHIPHQRTRWTPLGGPGPLADLSAELALYGPLATRAGGVHVALQRLQLKPGSTIGDVMARFGIRPEEKGFVFVNAVLCDVPGLNASWAHSLADGDHVGVFSLGYMWPYQYRDGARMSEALREALRRQGPMHHSYTTGEPG